MDKIVEKCGVCGGRPRGECPALGKRVCAACCGSGRGSKIKCPADCAHFPFSIAGYDLWLEIDRKLAQKMLKYLIDNSRDEFVDTIDDMRFDKDKPPDGSGTAEGAAVYYLFFVKRGADGLTLAQKWQAQGWAGLNNDERIMMECRFSCRATVLEVQKILDHQRMECIDLLDKERGSFILVDRAGAAGTVRFTRLLTWLADYPCYSRAVNNYTEISNAIFPDFMASLHAMYEEKRRKKKGISIKDFL